MGRSLVTAVLCTLLCAQAQAQIVNVLDAVGREEDGFDAELSLTGTWNTGNTELLQANLGLLLSYKIAAHLVYLNGRASYGVKGDEVFVNHTFEHLRYRYSFLDWLSAEAFAQHEFDEFRRINLRLVAGIGPRFGGKVGDSLVWNFGTTYMFQHEIYELDPADPGPDRATEHRWSSYLQAGWQLNDVLSLGETVFVQPRFDDFSDVRVMSETSLRVQGTEWFSVKVSFRLDYDARPPVAVSGLDTSLETSFVFSIPEPPKKEAEAEGQVAGESAGESASETETTSDTETETETEAEDATAPVSATGESSDDSPSTPADSTSSSTSPE